MKVDIDSAELAKLKVDADDNKQVVRIVRIIVIGLIFMLLYFTWGHNILNTYTKKLEADIYAEATITQAYANARARSIESEGLTNEEYFKWVEVRNSQ